MRRHVALGCMGVLASLSFACTGDGPRVSELKPSKSVPDAPASDDVCGNNVVALPMDVAGVVATDRDHPVIARVLVLVDAYENRHEAVTDEDGRFAVPGIIPPYDLMVAPVSSGPATVYLGIGRQDPYLELFERDGPTPSLEPQKLRVAVRTDTCHTAPCRVTAVTVSASGSGSTTTPCDARATATTIDVDHGWRVTAVPPGERIDLHVLLADRLSFAYSHIENLAVVPGATVNLGVIEPVTVPVTDPISIGVHGGVGELSEWRWLTSVFFEMSGSRVPPAMELPLMVVREPETTVQLPLIPGARMQASIAASHPRADGQGPFHRSIEAWSGERSLSVDPIALEMTLGPEIAQPKPGGVLVRHGFGFAWKAFGSAAFSTLTIADTMRGGIRMRVLTTGHEVPLARLAALGVPTLELGDHVLDLTTSPSVDADDAVSPDTALRRRRFDRTRPGAVAHLRVPFQVTR